MFKFLFLILFCWSNTALTATYTFTKLASGTVSNTSSISSAIDVSAYQNVVVYVPSFTTTCEIIPKFSLEETTNFSYTGQTVTVANTYKGIRKATSYTDHGGKIRVDGKYMTLSVNTGCADSIYSFSFIVAGVE